MNKEFLSSEECKALFNRIVGMTSGGGDTTVSIISAWSGSATWARNRVYTAADAQDNAIRINRSIKGANNLTITTRLDDEGLLQAVREAELTVQIRNESPEQIKDRFIKEDILSPTLWSQVTYNFGAEQRTDLVQDLISGVEDAGMLSAGTLRIEANGTAVIGTDGMFLYYPQTAVECSMTVRHPKGLASGWAGVNHYDLGRIDPKALAARALDKCIRSQNPVAIEPGRYTVIMEPQATADLFRPILEHSMERYTAEIPQGPFGKEPGRSKITEQVLDQRLMLSADPMEPDGSFLPYEPHTGVPYQPVTWISHGILRELAYSKRYALEKLGLDKAFPNSQSFKLSAMSGVQISTIEQMIEKTERGLLVTRFSGVRVVDVDSMLCSGYSRDGLWLIEKGKITKPVKNFRFTESPIFALNSLQDVGVPERVFAPGLAHMAPAVRVRDFSFTGLADAI